MTKFGKMMVLAGVLACASIPAVVFHPGQSEAAESSFKFSNAFSGIQARILALVFNTTSGHRHDGTDARAVNALGAGGTVTLTSLNKSTTDFILYGAASQTADLLRISTSTTAGTHQFRIDKDGDLIVAGGATITGSLTGAVTGNADTATALAANPTDCGANEFATTIAASGNLTCAAVTQVGALTATGAIGATGAITSAETITATKGLSGSTLTIAGFNTPVSSDPCSKGQMTFDALYIYGCSGTTGPWKRAAWTEY